MLTSRPNLASLSSLADSIAYQVTAAKLLEHHDAVQSSQHLHNAVVFHRQFGEMLSEIKAKRKGDA